MPKTKSTRLNEDLLDELAEWQEARGLTSSEAIRSLIRLGMRADALAHTTLIGLIHGDADAMLDDNLGVLRALAETLAILNQAEGEPAVDLLGLLRERDVAIPDETIGALSRMQHGKATPEDVAHCLVVLPQIVDDADEQAGEDLYERFEEVAGNA